MLNGEADIVMLSVRAQPPQHTAITVWTWANTNKQTSIYW